MRKETERRHTELKLELVSWTESETKSKQESKAKGRSSAEHQLRTSRWEDHRPSWEAGAGADSPQLSQERTAHGASARLGNSCPRSAQLTEPQPGSGVPVPGARSSRRLSLAREFLSQERTAHGASAWLRNSEGKTPSIVPAGAAGWDAAWSDDPSVSIAVIFSGTKVTASSWVTTDDQGKGPCEGFSSFPPLLSICLWKTIIRTCEMQAAALGKAEEAAESVCTPPWGAPLLYLLISRPLSTTSWTSTPKVIPSAVSKRFYTVPQALGNLPWPAARPSPQQRHLALQLNRTASTKDTPRVLSKHSCGTCFQAGTWRACTVLLPKREVTFRLWILSLSPRTSVRPRMMGEAGMDTDELGRWALENLRSWVLAQTR